jgi:nucleoside-diphosphate-sugar epimerase
MTKILVTGALGQIGSELVLELKRIYGEQNIISSDIRAENIADDFLPYEVINVLDQEKLAAVIKKYDIKIIYHLATILSAAGEKNPQLCYQVNLNGLYNVLELSRQLQVKQIIVPSSIAVFGPNTPSNNTPQQTIITPTTIYGVTKAAGELLCEYYVQKYALDIRGIRYPGLISYKALPGGGTTDYAVEIFYEAIKHQKYSCFLKSDTFLPMMYMDDAIRGTIELSNADFSKLKNHCDFNFAAMSFCPSELAEEIKKHIPEFQITYQPDFRQKIADSWPKSIDDSEARKQWNWQHRFGLKEMVEEMIIGLRKKLSEAAS